MCEAAVRVSVLFSDEKASETAESVSCFQYFTKATFCCFYEFTEIKSVSN